MLTFGITCSYFSPLYALIIFFKYHLIVTMANLNPKNSNNALNGKNKLSPVYVKCIDGKRENYFIHQIILASRIASLL